MFIWELRCILCPHIYSNCTITEHTRLDAHSTFSSSNVIYGIICQQRPSGFSVGQRGQTLCKRINEHKFDKRTQNKAKVKSEISTLPRTLWQISGWLLWTTWEFNSTIKWEIDELTYIKRFQVIPEGLKTLNTLHLLVDQVCINCFTCNLHFHNHLPFPYPTSPQLF